MRLLLRSVLICLTVLAMPLQGIPAIVMQHCAPMHERMQLASTAPPSNGSSRHAHDTAEEMTAVIADPVDEPGPSMTDATGPADAVVSADVNNTCSACAACCPALGIPASAVQVPTPLIESHVVQLSLMQANSFVPGGPDRPPRIILA